MNQVLLHLASHTAGLIMTVLCIRFVYFEQKNPLSPLMKKRERNILFCLITVSYIAGCFLPGFAAVLLPFFVAQSANDIKEQLVSTKLNNTLLCIAVPAFFLFTPFEEDATSYIFTALILYSLSFVFHIYGSGDAKLLTVVLFITATGSFENDIFEFLTFCLVSYAALFVFAAIRNQSRKRKGLPKERHVYFYPFLFLGYIVHYLVASNIR